VSTHAPGTFESCLKIVPLPVVREMRPLMDVVPGRVGREHWFVRALVVSRWAAEIVVRCGGSRVRRVLFVGDDWSEEFHDVELQDEAGRRLGKAKLAEGIAGVARLHAMIGERLSGTHRVRRAAWRNGSGVIPAPRPRPTQPRKPLAPERSASKIYSSSPNRFDERVFGRIVAGTPFTSPTPTGRCADPWSKRLAFVTNG
jgi:hypothetical protein